MTYEFRMPYRDAESELGHYLQRTGGAPRDAYSQFRVNMLREMLLAAEAVMEDEGVPPATAHRVIRGMIYGGRPHLADEGARIEMQDMITRMHVHGARPSRPYPMPGG